MYYQLAQEGQIFNIDGDRSIIHNLSQHRVVGPLAGIAADCSALQYGHWNSRIFFLGDTRAGKTHTVTAMCRALGGFVAEKISESGRTLEDYALAFAYDDNLGEVTGLELSSHAGHDLERTLRTLASAHDISSYSLRSTIEGTILVYNVLGDKGQERMLGELISRSRAYEERSLFRPSRPQFPGLLFTRAGAIPAGIVGRIAKETPGGQFKGVAYSADYPCAPSLADLPRAGIELVLKQIRRRIRRRERTDPVVTRERMIYFGDAPIPQHMQDLVVPFERTGLRFTSWKTMYPSQQMPGILTLAHPAFR